MRPARLPKVSAEQCLNAAAGEPAAYTIATARSLQLWLETPVDLADLFDGARTLLAQVDVWRRVQSKVADVRLLDFRYVGRAFLAGKGSGKSRVGVHGYWRANLGRKQKGQEQQFEGGPFLKMHSLLLSTLRALEDA